MAGLRFREVWGLAVRVGGFDLSHFGFGAGCLGRALFRLKACGLRA